MPVQLELHGHHCRLLGGLKPSPLGDGFSVPRRSNAPYERVPSWDPQRLRDPTAPGLDDQILDFPAESNGAPDGMWIQGDGNAMRQRGKRGATNTARLRSL